MSVEAKEGGRSFLWFISNFSCCMNLCVLQAGFWEQSEMV